MNARRGLLRLAAAVLLAVLAIPGVRAQRSEGCEILDDYTHKVLATEQLDGEAVVQIEEVPKSDAAVVWGRIIYWVRRADTMPLKQEFFSERGEPVPVLAFSDIRRVDGRILPTRWGMWPDAKPRNPTTIVLKDAVFDRPVNDVIFSQRNRQKR